VYTRNQVSLLTQWESLTPDEALTMCLQQLISLH
jgi:hypothetical protein